MSYLLKLVVVALLIYVVATFISIGAGFLFALLSFEPNKTMNVDCGSFMVVLLSLFSGYLALELVRFKDKKKD